METKTSQSNNCKRNRDESRSHFLKARICFDRYVSYQVAMKNFLQRFFFRGQSSIIFICSLLPKSVLPNFQSFIQLVTPQPETAACSTLEKYITWLWEKQLFTVSDQMRMCILRDVFQAGGFLSWGWNNWCRSSTGTSGPSYLPSRQSWVKGWQLC